MKFSVFDLDRTLLSKNSSFEFCKYLYRKKVFSFFFIVQSCIYYVRHKYLGMTLEQLHHGVFKKLLRGVHIQVLSDHVSSFIDQELEGLLYFPALERLRKAQHQGQFTMILSNSPAFLVSFVASKLKVDDWKASEYKVDKDQKLCQISSILNGKDKALWVDKIIQYLKIQKQEVTAYSDSYLDLPFLQSAGVPVVVNPDSRLRKISKERNWEEI